MLQAEVTSNLLVRALEDTPDIPETFGTDEKMQEGESTEVK